MNRWHAAKCGVTLKGLDVAVEWYGAMLSFKTELGKMLISMPMGTTE
jgi:hypothetical protein